jgi:hypothetical protein
MERLRRTVRDFKMRISTAAKILTGRIDPNSFEEW